MTRKLEACLWFVIFFLLGVFASFLSFWIKVIAAFLALFGTGKLKQYGLNVWEGFDNAASAETGGSPDESLSSRLGKAREQGSGWTYIANKVDLVALEFFGDEDHCQKSIERDRGKKQVTTY